MYITTATNLYPPPDDIYLADARPGTLVFNWIPVISNCSMLQYNISSDCGTCPTVTNATTAICSDLQLTTNASLCHFRVSSRACDLLGNPSSSFAVNLKGNFSVSHKKLNKHNYSFFLMLICSSQCSPSCDSSQLLEQQSSS